jgi:hypothetical protein
MMQVAGCRLQDAGCKKLGYGHREDGEGAGFGRFWGCVSDWGGVAFGWVLGLGAGGAARRADGELSVGLRTRYERTNFEVGAG